MTSTTEESNSEVNTKQKASFEFLNSNNNSSMHSSSAYHATDHRSSTSPRRTFHEHHRVKPKSTPSATHSPIVTKTTTSSATRSPHRPRSSTSKQRNNNNRETISKSPKKTRKTTTTSSEFAVTTAPVAHSPRRKYFSSSTSATKNSILLPPSTPATEVESVLSTPAGNTARSADTDTMTAADDEEEEEDSMLFAGHARVSPPATPSMPNLEAAGTTTPSGRHRRRSRGHSLERQQRQQDLSPERSAPPSVKKSSSKRSKKSSSRGSKSSKSSKKSSKKSSRKSKQRRRSTRELERMKYAKDQLEDSIRSGASQNMLVDMMKDDGEAVVGNLMDLVASTGDPELAKSFERPDFRQSFLRWLSQDRDLGAAGDDDVDDAQRNSSAVEDDDQPQRRSKSGSSSSKKDRRGTGKKYQPSLANPNAAFLPTTPRGTTTKAAKATTPANSKSKRKATFKPKREDSISSGFTESTPITDNLHYGKNKDMSPAYSEATKKMSNRIRDRKEGDSDEEEHDGAGSLLARIEHQQRLLQEDRPTDQERPSPDPLDVLAADARGFDGDDDDDDAENAVHPTKQDPPPLVATPSGTPTTRRQLRLPASSASPRTPPAATGSASPKVLYEDSEALSLAIHCFLEQQAKALAAMTNTVIPDQLEPSYHTANSTSLISMSESTFSSGALSQAIEKHLQSKVQKAGLKQPTTSAPAAPLGDNGAQRETTTTTTDRNSPTPVGKRSQSDRDMSTTSEGRRDDATEQSSLHPVSGGLMSIPSAPSESVVRKAVGLDDPTEASGALTSACGQSLPATNSVDLQRMPPPVPAVPPVQKISIPSPNTRREVNQNIAVSSPRREVKNNVDGEVGAGAPPPPPPQSVVDPPSVVNPPDGYNGTSMPPPPGETPHTQDGFRPTLGGMAGIYEQQQHLHHQQAMMPPPHMPYYPSDPAAFFYHQQQQQLYLQQHQMHPHGAHLAPVPVHIEPMHHEEVSVHSDITGLTGMDSRAATNFPRGRGMEVAVNAEFRMRKSYSSRHMTDEEKAIVRSPYASMVLGIDGSASGSGTGSGTGSGAGSGVMSEEPELILHAAAGAMQMTGSANVAARSPYPRDFLLDDDDNSSSSSDSDDSDSESDDDQFDHKGNVMGITAAGEFPGAKPVTRLPRHSLRPTQSAPPTTTRVAEYVRSREQHHQHRVRFGNVTVREYERILGDNPSCTSGPALGIGWRVSREREMELTDFAPRERYGAIDHALILDRDERETLLIDLGYSKKEIAQSVRTLTKWRNQRKQTVGNLRNERIEYAMEKAKHRLIRILTVKKQQSSSTVPPAMAIGAGGNSTSSTSSPLPSTTAPTNKNSFQQHFIQHSTNVDDLKSLPPF